MTVVGLMHSGLRRAQKRRTPWGLWSAAVAYKANPREPAYMDRLFREHWPDGMLVWVGADPDWAARSAAASTVVLLYPDAIGLGFRPVERRLRVLGVEPRVLNGRRRHFRLTRAMRGRLGLRRILEWTMLAELAAVPVFALATPALLAIDLLRGRR